MDITTTTTWNIDDDPPEEGMYLVYNHEWGMINRDFWDGESWLNSSGSPEAWAPSVNPLWTEEDLAGVYQGPLHHNESIWQQRTDNTGIDWAERFKVLARAISAPWAWPVREQSGVPVFYVDAAIPKVPVLMDPTGSHLSQRLLNGVPIPVGFHGNQSSDGHAVIIDRVEDVCYEFYQVRQNPDGLWVCRWGAIIDRFSQSDGRVPIVQNEKQGARASGFSLIGGVVLYQELLNGVIPHAIAIGAPLTYHEWQHPAFKPDGTPSAQGLRYGVGYRFPTGYVIDPSWNDWTKMLVTAIRDYGLYVVDQTGANNKFSVYHEDRSRFFGADNVYTQFTNRLTTSAAAADTMNAINFEDLEVMT